MKLLHDLVSAKKITPPSWMVNNTIHAVITGSYAYGINTNSSDIDIYGICLPPLKMIFPHLTGEIQGFGEPAPRFQHFQQHHVNHDHKTYDFTIYSIVKFFNLAMKNNPNIIDVLFLPQNCVLHSTPSSQKIILNRDQFLHTGLFSEFVGYAVAQQRKMREGANRKNEKRKQTIDTYGYDTKFASHNVRLLVQAKSLFENGEINFKDHAELIMSVRNGEWSLEKIDEWTENVITELRGLRDKSTLPSEPNYVKLKALLMEIIEDHYGPVSMKIINDSEVLGDLKRLLEKYQ